jgi:hypothetical protein
VGVFLSAVLSRLLNRHIADAYCNDCFPKRQVFSPLVFVSGMLMSSEQGEISALTNLARVLGGFSVAYFQVPWAVKHGALQTFGVEAACVVSACSCSCLPTNIFATNSIVVGLFVLIVPALQLKGRYLRVSYIN